MTKFLKELVTDATPVLKIEDDHSKSIEEKLKVIDLESLLAELYIKNLYFYNGKWYYFKQEAKDVMYPFGILDELMGSYLARLRDLPTVSYQIAEVEDKTGIASVNFKHSDYQYYTLDQLIDIIMPSYSGQNVSFLRNCTFGRKNEEQFLKHLFDLFALDIHMLQMDRGYANLQFQVNKKNNHFDIAPLYDYSHCLRTIGVDGLNVPSHIAKLNDFGISILLQQYPMFRKSLELCLEHSMKELWDQICVDYHFNKECSAYEQVKDYYEIKDVTQKRYIKNLLNNNIQIKKSS